MSCPVPHAPSSPAAAPAWDLSRLIGFTKISLLGLSSSRVYGVYPATKDVLSGTGPGIRPSLFEPEFLIKVNDNADRGLREHAALKRLSDRFPKEVAALFYVHQSFLFRSDELDDTATFSPVQIEGRFPTMADLAELNVTGRAKFDGLCLDADCNTVDKCWWNLPRGPSGPAAATFATVVMKRLHSFGRLDAVAFSRIPGPVTTWMEHIHAARVLHTDIRPSNLMWMPLKDDTVARAQGFDLHSSSETVFADQSNRLVSVPRSLLSQFNELRFVGTMPREGQRLRQQQSRQQKRPSPSSSRRRGGCCPWSSISTAPKFWTTTRWTAATWTSPEPAPAQSS
eukprot:gene9937-7114_t